jgi:hypothetical protein
LEWPALEGVFSVMIPGLKRRTLISMRAAQRVQRNAFALQHQLGLP